MSKKPLNRCASAALVLATAAAAPVWAQIPAFPGAEGAGMFATGGRGQTIYHVTNLNTSGAGSFADAVSQSNRYIVFDVGGTVVYNGGGPNYYIRSGASNITVAGETAPGQGFTITGVTAKFTGGNVVVRNIRSRPGFDPLRPTSYTYDCFGIEATNSVFDHLSADFASDESISPTGAVNGTTIQYANIGYALNGQNHAFGSLVRSDNDGSTITIAHTVYSNVRSRLPRVGSENTATGMITATLDFTNNTVYDWNGNAGYSGDGSANPSGTGHQPSKNNFVGNYYIYGPSSTSSLHMFGNYDTTTQLFISGNYEDTNKNGAIDGSAVSSSALYAGSSVAPVVSSTPFAIQGTYAQTAVAATQQNLNYGGAFWWNRDQVDTDAINDVRNGTGAIINNISDRYSGTSYYTASSSRPAGYDTDNDGMPNVWETAMGLNPNVADNNGDVNGNGYTNIEKFTQELAAFPAPAPLIFNSAGGRFALIGNWSITETSPVAVTTNWSPSRFDEAQINAGTATQDAVGMHAGTLKIATNSGNTAALSVTSGWLDVAQSLLVGPGGTGSVTQTGGIVHAGTSVVIGGTNNAGTYNLSGGTLSTSLLTKGAKGGTFNFTGGLLHADTIAFSLTNQGGTLAPGSDAQLETIAAAAMPDVNGNVPAVPSTIGNTHVKGSLTFSSGALQIELASLASFDSVTVDSALTLGGALNVQQVSGYTPTFGDLFKISTAASIAGSFGSITSGWTTQVNGGNLYLIPQSSVAEWKSDTNGTWSITPNWKGGAPGESGGPPVANFLSLISAPRTVTVDGTFTVSGITFNNANSYTLAGDGVGGHGITLDGGSATVNDNGGSHVIAAPVTLNSNTTVTVSASGAALTISGAIGGTGGLIVAAGSGVVNLNGANTYAGDTTVNVGGALNVNGSLPSTAVVNANGALNFAGSTTNSVLNRPLAQLNIGGGATTRVTPSSSAVYPALLQPANLTFANGATLDLTNNEVITNADFNIFMGRVTSGQIFSSSSGGAVGYLDLGGGSVEARFTLLGDSDLNGNVNVADLSNLAANFNVTTGAIWINGDFDYNGNVNVADLADLAGNFGQSLSSVGAGEQSAAPAGAVAVPEPASAMLVVLGAVSLRACRRRQRRAG
jgi:autotransporter-associated beta strand protein